LLDVRNAMQELPIDQREVLVLVAAAGLPYEETAAICGCAVGTVKSRVSRARANLAAILELRSSGRRTRSGVSASGVFDEFMQDAAKLQAGAAVAEHPGERLAT
jgi:RNA polymerase sigma-70 factor (ECF subfamily)